MILTRSDVPVFRNKQMSCKVIDAHDRIIFFDEGVILEDTTPQAFFSNPDHERAQAFLSQVRHGF